MPCEISSLNLTHENHKKAINLIVDVVKQTKNLCEKLVENNCERRERICENIECGSKYVLSKLNEINTILKLKKIVRKNPKFVYPIEKSIGLKWKIPRVDPKTRIPDYG